MKKTIMAALIATVAANADYNYGYDHIGDLNDATYDSGGMYSNKNNENAYSNEITIPASVTRYKHVRKVITRVHYVDCAPPGGDEKPTKKLEPWGPFPTNTKTWERVVTLYGFTFRISRKEGGLGTPGYAQLLSCPLGDQNVVLYAANVGIPACDGQILYNTKWDNISGKQEFYFSYFPNP